MPGSSPKLKQLVSARHGVCLPVERRFWTPHTLGTMFLEKDAPPSSRHGPGFEPVGVVRSGLYVSSWLSPKPRPFTPILLGWLNSITVLRVGPDYMIFPNALGAALDLGRIADRPPPLSTRPKTPEAGFFFIRDFFSL